MAQYIDKSALVAEIERKKEEVSYDDDSKSFASYADRVYYLALDSMQDFIDTLEVKDVNLDESARYYLLHEHISPLNDVLHQAGLKVEMQYHKDIEDAYKAGFELGLKAKQG